MKILIYSGGFMPPYELIDFAIANSYESIYDPAFVSDPRTIEFVEARLQKPYDIYRGKPSTRYRIGFAGFAQIVEVDPTRTWRLADDYSKCIGYQRVEYVEVVVDQNGRISVLKAEKQ
ncbi:MAG: hypothetical protein MJ246_01675 [Clostridia bacterium]|nr:hypothetical protein [Clostridia bacterium]